MVRTCFALAAFASSFCLPDANADALQAFGRSDGKSGSVVVEVREGRILVRGAVTTDEAPAKRTLTSGYIGCTLYVGGKTIDLKPVAVHGKYTEFFSIDEYRKGKFTVALWAKKVSGSGSYDRKFGFHLEGRIASVDGAF